MKRFIFALLMIVSVGAGARMALADCNPWVQQCLTSFRVMEIEPLQNGVRASMQKCNYLGCGW
jgi:hypothetical protein